MNVLYEEDGEFKVGAVLATNPGVAAGRKSPRPALEGEGRAGSDAL